MRAGVAGLPATARRIASTSASASSSRSASRIRQLRQLRGRCERVAGALEQAQDDQARVQLIQPGLVLLGGPLRHAVGTAAGRRDDAGGDVAEVGRRLSVPLGGLAGRHVGRIACLRSGPRIRRFGALRHPSGIRRGDRLNLPGNPVIDRRLDGAVRRIGDLPAVRRQVELRRLDLIESLERVGNRRWRRHFEHQRRLGGGRRGRLLDRSGLLGNRGRRRRCRRRCGTTRRTRAAGDDHHRNDAENPAADGHTVSLRVSVDARGRWVRRRPTGGRTASVRAGPSAPEILTAVWLATPMTRESLGDYIRGVVVARRAEEGADTFNVCLRSVHDDCWPFPAGVAVAPLPVVAVDLADSLNARERRVGGELPGRQ